jgi:ATP-dependent RNA helicase DDX56/DBP9
VFDKKELESFRYRANDALRAVSRVAVREARTRELRQELLKSAKLERHFEENPSEMQHLIRHDGEIRAARTQAHLRNVPDYLLPKDGTKALTENDIGFVPIRTKSGRKDRRQKGKGHHGRSFKVGKKKADPLKSFKARSKR